MSKKFVVSIFSIVIFLVLISGCISTDTQQSNVTSQSSGTTEQIPTTISELTSISNSSKLHVVDFHLRLTNTTGNITIGGHIGYIDPTATHFEFSSNVTPSDKFIIYVIYEFELRSPDSVQSMKEQLSNYINFDEYSDYYTSHNGKMYLIMRTPIIQFNETSEYQKVSSVPVIVVQGLPDFYVKAIKTGIDEFITDDVHSRIIMIYNENGKWYKVLDYSE